MARIEHHLSGDFGDMVLIEDVWHMITRRSDEHDDGGLAVPIRLPNGFRIIWHDAEIQRRAVAYGAQDVLPDYYGRRTVEWPVDSERVSLERITYDRQTDEFSGYSLRNEPEWTQR